MDQNNKQQAQNDPGAQQTPAPADKGRALRTNLIFAAVLVVLALGIYLLTLNRAAAGIAVLTYGDEQKTMELPLDKNEIYHVDTGYFTVNIEVKDGAARFTHSPCPDHICEGYGWLSQDGDWAACLPARANLTVLEAE